MSNGTRLSIVGATGLVGREILRLVEERGFEYDDLTLFASSRSAGEELFCAGQRLLVRELTREDFLSSTDLALCSAGRAVSYNLREWAAGGDVVVVDNSSAFRMDPDVPLVVPEVNPAALLEHSGYIANPNCSTIQLVVALKPLHDAFELKRVVASTYQSVSGAGQSGMSELSAQSIALFNQGTVEQEVFPRRIAFNLVPHIGPFDDEGYTEEETKVTHETRKILGLPELGVSCTAVRVPVFAGHAESVMVELGRDAEVGELRDALSGFPGLRVMDDPSAEVYPTPVDCVHKDEVLVGRIRRDPSGPRSFHLWIVADNLGKGAALNTLQIAEKLRQQALH